jgi:hypothetical protein
MDNKKVFGIGGVVAVVVIVLLVGFGSKSCSGAHRNSTMSRGGESTTIRIEKVVTAPTGKEAVTIKNVGGEEIDLSGWSLGDKNDPDGRGLRGVLKAGESKRYDRESLGFGINNKKEIIYLKKNGKTIDKWEGN